MHSPVHSQILGIGETLSADVAYVGLFPGVDPSVLLQVLGATETLSAVIAEVQLRRIVALLVPEK